MSSAHTPNGHHPVVLHLWVKTIYDEWSTMLHVTCCRSWPCWFPLAHTPPGNICRRPDVAGDSPKTEQAPPPAPFQSLLPPRPPAQRAIAYRRLLAAIVLCCSALNLRRRTTPRRVRLPLRTEFRWGMQQTTAGRPCSRRARSARPAMAALTARGRVLLRTVVRKIGARAQRGWMRRQRRTTKS